MKSKAQLDRFITFILTLHRTNGPANSKSTPIHAQWAAAPSFPLTRFLQATLERVHAREPLLTPNMNQPQLVFRLSTPE